MPLSGAGLKSGGLTGYAHSGGSSLDRAVKLEASRTLANIPVLNMTAPIDRPLISGINPKAAAGAEPPGLGLYEPRTLPHQQRESLIIAVRPFVPAAEAPFPLPLRHRAAEGGWVQGARSASVRSGFPKVAIGLKLRRTLEAAMKDSPPPRPSIPPTLLARADEVIE